jgi:hypothetical protein
MKMRKRIEEKNQVEDSKQKSKYEKKLKKTVEDEAW